MKKYIPSEIEGKWQEKWKEDGLYLTNLSEDKNKYYVLVELPYTSGDLHMGHWFTFTMGDILARFKRKLGFNVLFPNGFDAFGLPAENAAIKNNVHPRDWTYQNMERMKTQFETLGTSIDWTKTMIACDPKYYKWNQWIFLKMLEKGTAYRGKTLSNWCPNCQTVLANENVEAGHCWRCGTEVIQKQVEQWFFKITDYADRLLWKDVPQADWPKSLIAGQNEWIGKKTGINIIYKIEGSDEKVEVFTTRPDTNFGATFIALAPEHPLVLKITTKDRLKEVKEYISQAGKKSELERKEDKEKTGVFTGSYAINDLTGSKMPIWISDFVLMGFGTGALVGVPAHDKRDFEFASKFNLEIKRVVVGSDGDTSAITQLKQVQEEEGKMINSDFLDGLDIHEATEKIMEYMEEKGYGKKTTTYHLHDWSISRQRYWGTPIPIIYCDKCGTVPVPEKDLPVELPYKIDYTPQGKPPLATVEDWVRVACPECGGTARREVETMDTFVDSAWYFFRYLDPENDTQPFDKLRAASWMPLDIYIGGPEHTLGHALYSRFFTMIFEELGLINFKEYAKKRIHHGTILGPDGARMSKSKGNVINPDLEVKKYGADAIRLYLMFLGPFDIVTAWNDRGVEGIFHFLQRIWSLQEKVEDSPLTSNDLRMMHKTIKKVTEDLEELKFNTAIASMMEWLNYLSRKDKITTEEYITMLHLLSPFAPHMTEELYQTVILRPKAEESLADASLKQVERSFADAQDDNFSSIHQQSFPKFDNKYLVEEQVSVVVQVNGKVRDILMIGSDTINNKDVIEKMALDSEKVQKNLDGKTVKKVVYIPGKILNLVV